MSTSRVNRRLSLVAALSLFASAAVFACSDDDKTGSTSSDAGTGADVANKVDGNSNVDTGIVENNVSIILTGTYNSAAEPGVMIASVWPNAPVPGGTPVGVGTNEKPTWPGTNSVSIKNVPPGHYNVYSYLMTGPTDHRTGKLPSDPGGKPQPVDVVAGQTVNATVTFGIAPPADAGSDADADAP